jgi:hypothetical protein
LTYPLLTVDQLHYVVTRITTHNYDNNKEIDRGVLKTATGFFYRNIKNKLLFLITNRHVVRDPNENYFPNAIKLMLHTDINDMTQNTEYPIHLYNGTKPIWRYPNHPEADVVAIPMNLHDFVTHRIICRSFATNNMLKEYKLDIADDIFIMGYPLSIYDEVHNLPLIRGGTISSPYPIPWKHHPYFLVEATLHEGTSGSPVITKFKSIWRRVDNNQRELTGPGIFFLGIVSSKFPDRDDVGVPLRLNAVYFAHTIDEMTA